MEGTRDPGWESEQIPSRSCSVTTASRSPLTQRTEDTSSARPATLCHGKPQQGTV